MTSSLMDGSCASLATWPLLVIRALAGGSMEWNELLLPETPFRYLGYATRVCKGYIFLQFELEKFSEVANDVDAIALAPLAKFDSVCDTVQGEDEYAEDGTGN